MVSIRVEKKKRKRKIDFEKGGGATVTTPEGRESFTQDEYKAYNRQKSRGASKLGETSQKVKDFVSAEEAGRESFNFRRKVLEDAEKEKEKEEILKTTPEAIAKEQAQQQIQEQTRGDVESIINPQDQAIQEASPQVAAEQEAVANPFLQGVMDFFNPAGKVERETGTETLGGVLPVTPAVGAAAASPTVFAGVKNLFKTKLGGKITNSGGVIKGAIGLATGGFIVGALNKRISNLETSVVNIRESASFVQRGYQTGVLDAETAINNLDELEAQINELDAEMKKAGKYSLDFWLGRGREIETRVQKARLDIALRRGAIRQGQALEDPTQGTLLYLELLNQT